MHQSRFIVKITTEPIHVDDVISQTKTSDSGCLATYIGLIRDNNKGKSVAFVEYQDVDGKASEVLADIAREMVDKWSVNRVAILHRIGILKVGEINFLVVVAAAHRREGFAACRYAVDQFKARLPTRKIESYISDNK